MVRPDLLRVLLERGDPSEPAIVELIHIDKLDKPTRVPIYDGKRFRLLGFLGGTGALRAVAPSETEELWKTAYFLAPPEWIGKMEMKRKVRGVVALELRDAGKLPVFQLTLRRVTEEGLSQVRSWSKLSQDAYEKFCHLRFNDVEFAEKEQAYPPPSWAKQAGMTIYRRHYQQWVFPYSAPQKDEITKQLSITLARGEREPLTFTVYPHRDFKEFRISFSKFKDGGREFKGKIELGVVDYRYIHHRRMNESTGEEIKECGIGPRRLLPMQEGKDSISLAEKKSQRIWLTVTDTPGTKPGTYTGAVRLEADGKVLVLPTEIRVLPIVLPPSPVKHGFYVSSAPRDSEVRQMRSLGMQTMALSCGLGELGLTVLVKNGRIHFDFEKIDARIQEFRKSGFSGPIFLQMFKISGQLSHREWRRLRALGYVRHLGEAVHTMIGKGQIVTQEYFDAFARELKRIADHANQAGWGESISIAGSGLTDVKAPGVHDYSEALHRLDPSIRLYVSATDRWRKNGFYWEGRYGSYLREFMSAGGRLLTTLIRGWRSKPTLSNERSNMDSASSNHTPAITSSAAASPASRMGSTPGRWERTAFSSERTTSTAEPVSPI